MHMHTDLSKSNIVASDFETSSARSVMEADNASRRARI